MPWGIDATLDNSGFRGRGGEERRGGDFQSCLKVYTLAQATEPKNLRLQGD